MGDIGPSGRVELAEGLGREERDVAEEASSLVFIQDIYGGFGSGSGARTGWDMGNGFVERGGFCLTLATRKSLCLV